MRELDLKEKEVIEEIRCATGLEEGQIIQVFESLSNIYAIGQFSVKEKVYIPFLGDLYLQFSEDIIKGDHKEAIVRGFFSPNDVLKKNIGYYQDFLASQKKEHLEMMPSFQYIKNRTESSLKKD
jgi:hypothetical protein